MEDQWPNTEWSDGEEPADEWGVVDEWPVIDIDGWPSNELPSDEPPAPIAILPQTRGYQQEMLEESLTRNLIIALDTGSGKTLIAILRMKVEAEREAKKVNLLISSLSRCF